MFSPSHVARVVAGLTRLATKPVSQWGSLDPVNLLGQATELIEGIHGARRCLRKSDGRVFVMVGYAGDVAVIASDEGLSLISRSTLDADYDMPTNLLMEEHIRAIRECDMWRAGIEAIIAKLITTFGLPVEEQAANQPASNVIESALLKIQLVWKELHNARVNYGNKITECNNLTQLVRKLQAGTTPLPEAEQFDVAGPQSRSN